MSARVKRILGLMLTMVLAGSCKLYSPTMAPVSLLSAKHEMHLSGGIALPSGLSGSCAYSPLEHISANVFGSAGTEKTFNFQSMAGYYWKNPQNYLFEIGGGFSVGRGSAFKTSASPKLDGKYSTYFVQASFGQLNAAGRGIDYGFGFKAGLMDMHLTDYGYYENIQLDPTKDHNTYYMLEPVAFIRFGKRAIRPGFQLDGTSLINTHSNQKAIPLQTIGLAFSLNYQFSVRK